MKSSSVHFHLLIVTACLFFVFFIGTSSLKSDPLAEAEYNSLKHLFSRSLNLSFDIFGTVESVSSYSEQHSPLYFLLLNLWGRLTCEDLGTLRLLSVYFGILTVAMVYRLGLLTGDLRLATNGVIIITFMSFFIFYTHELRMYSLLPFCAGWVVWSYWQALSRRGQVSWRKWLSLFISAALILYVHYFGMMILAAIGIYHLLFAPKNKRWFQINLVMIGGSLMFLLWLPVVIQGLATRANLERDRLTWFESIRTIITIYSNGMWLLPIGLAGLLVWNFKSLDKPRKYLLILTCLVISVTILVNEFTPILVEFRMRYTTVLAVLLACSFAIGLTFLPKQKILQFPLLLIWAGSFFLFTDSTALSVYTNRQRQKHETVPHYQKFAYVPPTAPGYGETMLSFHPTNKITWKMLVYVTELSGWKSLIHIYYDKQDEIIIQSAVSQAAGLEDITSNNNALWLIHNPQQTDLQAMDVYAAWLSQHYKPCQRLFESDDAIIDYYMKTAIPCELIHAQTPFEVRYDNGTHLANRLYETDDEQLTFYFWWAQTVDLDYAFSIQIFDERNEKVGQYDNVAGLHAFDVHTMDISMLAGGEYVARLILYDAVTQVSQPGILIGTEQRFERDIEIARLTITD